MHAAQEKAKEIGKINLSFHTPFRCHELSPNCVETMHLRLGLIFTIYLIDSPNVSLASVALLDLPLEILPLNKIWDLLVVVILSFLLAFFVTTFLLL